MKIVKGKALPLTTEEKIMLGVKEAARQNEDWKSCVVWVTSLSISKSTQTPLTEKTERIAAEGTCSLGVKCIKRDMILNPKDCSFKVQITDSTDEWGLPDVQVESFSFKENR